MIYEIKNSEGVTVTIIEHPHPLATVELIETIPAVVDNSDEQNPVEITPASYVFGIKNPDGGVVFTIPSKTNTALTIEEQTND